MQTRKNNSRFYKPRERRSKNVQISPISAVVKNFVCHLQRFQSDRPQHQELLPFLFSVLCHWTSSLFPSANSRTQKLVSLLLLQNPTERATLIPNCLTQHCLLLQPEQKMHCYNAWKIVIEAKQHYYHNNCVLFHLWWTNYRIKHINDAAQGTCFPCAFFSKICVALVLLFLYKAAKHII